MRSARRSAILFCALVALVGCTKSYPLAGTRCEGGPGGGGECMQIVDAKDDRNPDTVGTLQWAAHEAPKYSVRKTAAKGKYVLVRDEKAVGRLEHEEKDEWVFVRFDDGAEPSTRTANRRIALRAGKPGPFI